MDHGRRAPDRVRPGLPVGAPAPGAGAGAPVAEERWRRRRQGGVVPVRLAATVQQPDGERALRATDAGQRRRQGGVVPVRVAAAVQQPNGERAVRAADAEGGVPDASDGERLNG